MTHPHTTNLEASQKLAAACKEKGVEMPESTFFWCEYTYSSEREDGYGEIVTDWLLEAKKNLKFRGLDVGLNFEAYQLGELMRMLPHEILFESKVYYLSIRYYIGLKAWVLKYLTDSGSDKLAEGKNDVPEDAAAALLTELILQEKIKTISL